MSLRLSLFSYKAEAAQARRKTPGCRGCHARYIVVRPSESSET